MTTEPLVSKKQARATTATTTRTKHERTSLSSTPSTPHSLLSGTDANQEIEQQNKQTKPTKQSKAIKDEIIQTKPDSPPGFLFPAIIHRINANPRQPIPDILPETPSKTMCVTLYP